MGHALALQIVRVVLFFVLIHASTACSFEDDPCNGSDQVRSQTTESTVSANEWKNGICTTRETDACHAAMPEGFTLVHCGHAAAVFRDGDAGADGVYALECMRRSTAKDCKSTEEHHKSVDVPVPLPNG